MPRDFHHRGRFHIDAQCRTYLSPLIQGEAPPPYKNDCPNVKLKTTCSEEASRFGFSFFAAL